ncbi:MAG: hypothetical protein D8M58_03155 [Calditrichaeota bacterium]|nr:MAG: hypothetical protein DWQ03_03925 [Calditrichota bacterium]MBL1204364.1 hypothetical protein [Calditrichota bacterium]NOG44193.1 hypothetical protein [Calditrichota bacterium]
MQEIKNNQEHGGALITIVSVVLILATLGFILATVSSSSSTLQMLESEEQRSFYAAQSGMEYGLKEYLAADDIEDWSVEGMYAGDGVTSNVSMSVNEVTNEVVITSVGVSSRSTNTLETVISKTDSNNVPDYAVYSKKPVLGVVTKDSLAEEGDAGLVYENAPAAPVFDMDKLRTLAQATQDDGNSYYYEDDLVIGEDFNPPDGTIVFTEGKLTFAKGSWEGNVHFVAMDDIAFQSTWRNSDDVKMTVYLGEPNKKVWIEPRDYDDDPVEFDITDGEVIPQEPYAAQITILGCAYEAYSGNTYLYDAPITINITIGGEDIYPFGNNPTRYESNLRNKVDAGNVNIQADLPVDYTLPNLYDAGTSISITARGWARNWYYYFFGEYWWNRYGSYDLIDEAESTNPSDADIVQALRDGDNVPTVEGFGSQASAEEFIGSYVDFSSQTVTLDESQAIYLIDLSNASYGDPGYDFQDIVVLVTLAKEQDDFISGGTEGETETEYALPFTGGIISHAPVYGSAVDTYEGEDITSTIQVVRDEEIISDFLKYSVNGNSRVILESKWKRKN